VEDLIYFLIGLNSISESLASGASIAALGPIVALAIIIGIQNVPEGIDSYKEMMTGKTAFNNNPKKVLTVIEIVFVISVFFRINRFILFARYRICYFNYPCVISRWDIPYALL
jgi:hypothetical protein